MSEKQDAQPRQPRQPSLSQLTHDLDEVLDDAMAALRLLQAVKALVHETERELIAQARAEGVAWSVIGPALGVTKQAAAKRFGSAPATPKEAATGSGDSDRATSTQWRVTTPSGRELLRVSTGQEQPDQSKPPLRIPFGHFRFLVRRS